MNNLFMKLNYDFFVHLEWFNIKTYNRKDFHRNETMYYEPQHKNILIMWNEGVYLTCLHNMTVNLQIVVHSYIGKPSE